jgi:hypothetical protein
MRCLDYGSSFICHTGRENSVRFWVESRTRLVDGRAGTGLRAIIECPVKTLTSAASFQNPRTM